MKGRLPPRHERDEPWAQRLRRAVAVAIKRFGADPAFSAANEQSVRRAIQGIGPDSPQPAEGAGARMVVNLSSAHIPGFCRDGYKNAYDLLQYAAHRKLPPTVSEKRRCVDEALPLPSGTHPRVYFGALELNGCGMRFYGDICLVLKSDAVHPDTVVLDRNSYDVVRAPIVERIDACRPTLRETERKRHLRKWHGLWGRDLGAIAAIKALGSLGWQARRWTTGQISGALLDDEDYIEVLKVGNFLHGHVQEARVAAGDAAHDGLTGTRLSMIPAPRLESLIWRNRRSKAEAALRSVGIPVRVVTTASRTRG